MLQEKNEKFSKSYIENGLLHHFQTNKKPSFLETADISITTTT